MERNLLLVTLGSLDPCATGTFLMQRELSFIQDKSEAIILIGYHGIAGYKLYSPVTKKVAMSKDLVVKEDEAWDWEKGEAITISIVEIHLCSEENTENDHSDAENDAATTPDATAAGVATTPATRTQRIRQLPR